MNRARSSARPISRSIASACARAGSSSPMPITSRCSACAATRPRSRFRRAYQGARRDFAADCFPNDLRRELAQELEDIAHVLDEAFRVLRDDRLRLTYLHNLVE